MASWVAPVVGVVLVALTIIVFFSIDTLAFTQIGLNYSFISETVEKSTYKYGRYYLGLGNHFIKFPRVVQSMYFVDSPAEAMSSLELNAPHQTGPALQSRTQDGLTVFIEVSFQYKIIQPELYDLYQELGEDYHKVLMRIAIEELTTATTKHIAHDFFRNRTWLATEMHSRLDEHFKKRGHSTVPFFQLRTVRLPTPFEEAIEDTQVKEQEIKVAKADQQQRRVEYQTRVIQAEQDFLVRQQQAVAEANATIAQNDAYCRQYALTQMLQADALEQMMAKSGWSGGQVLEYLRIRAVRDHPSDHTTIQL